MRHSSTNLPCATREEEAVTSNVEPRVVDADFFLGFETDFGQKFP